MVSIFTMEGQISMVSKHRPVGMVSQVVDTSWFGSEMLTFLLMMIYVTIFKLNTFAHNRTQSAQTDSQTLFEESSYLKPTTKRDRLGFRAGMAHESKSHACIQSVCLFY